MIRILHSVSNMDRAGIETMLMNYYRHIDKEKIQFDFLCNKTKPGAYDDEIVKMGGHIYHSPGLNPINFSKYDKYMKKLFEDNCDIKIMHSHNGEFAYQSLRGAFKYGIKVRICHAHNTKIEPNFKKPLKLLYKTQLKKVANNYWGCGVDAVSFYFGNSIVSEGKFHILNNAIDVDKFIFNNEIRKKTRTILELDNKFVIGHVGRFMEQKNHKFILELFKKVLQKEKNAVLVLIGDGELQEKMKQMAKNLKIDHAVRFLGNIDNVNEVYQAMDVFILPSLFEGLPVVGIEAQASGLRCFFSDCITREVEITKNVTYLNLQKDSLDVWAKRILENKNYERKDMKSLIEKAGYSIKEEAKKLEEKYFDLLHNS